MDGIIAVYKPEGFTSFDVIAKLRGIMGQRRLGHNGTLDPMATGVLVVFAGAATKAIDLVPDNTKSYRAAVRLGVRTDTGDITGTVVETSGVRPSLEQLRAAAERFVGVSLQTPPMYSAVKVNGKKLYDLARKGQVIERAPREIVIDIIDIPELTADGFIMDVYCRKGVYIRALAEDIAGALGACATLSALERTSSGGFKIGDCRTLDEIESAQESGTLESMLLPVDRVFATYPALELAPKETHLFMNGVALEQNRVKAPAGTSRVYANGVFLALGECKDSMFKKTAQFYWEE